MSKLVKLLGIIAIISIVGFSLSTCKDDIEDSPPPALTGTVTINGEIEVDQTLIANTDALGGSGTISYQWRRGETNVGTNSNAYTIQASDVGSAISVTVTRSENSGSVTSASTAAVPPQLTGTVSITGIVQVGQTLTANTGSLGGSGAISYQWMREGTINIGTNNNTYTVQADDVGSTISVTVTRSGHSGSVSSASTAAGILPPLTGTVSIIGNAWVGETLSVNIGALGGSGDVSYQWRRGTTDLGSDSIYTLQTADAGSTIVVIVTRSENSGSVTSGLTSSVILPPLTGTVGITGTAHVGQTLTADTANLGGGGTISYQWRRGTTNVGTNSGTYVVQSTDVGSSISVIVTRAENSGSVTSSSTAIVPSVLTGTVSITGTAHVGQTLTANTNSLGGSGVITYQWRRGTVNIGNNSNTYIVEPADIGSSITLIVTRANNSGSITSASTAVVPPVLSGMVSITGTAQVGQILTADVTNLGGSGTITYQWRRGTTNIGTNSSAYTVQSADVGFSITVTVTRAGHSGSVTSDPADTVTLPPLTGTVSITGNAIVGQTLSANISALGGSGTVSYQWRRNGANIGSNSSSYTVQSADVGSTINVTVTRTGFTGSIPSEPTSTVIFPLLTGTVNITGTVQVGQNLTANTNLLNGSGTISYQWMRGGTVNIGTNSNTYNLQAADVGSTITVVVTRASNSGSVTSNPTAIVIFPPLTGSVSITGTAHVGQTLTANTASLGGSGTISYQWRRGTTNIGTDSSTYVVQDADVGSTINVVVTRANNSGSVTSASTATVPVVLTGTVSITGNAQIGQTLTANTASLGGSGTITYQWRRGTTNIGTNNSTYVVAIADVGSTISVIVTRANNSGSVESSPTSSVPLGPVSITGTVRVGQALTANTDNLGGTGTLSYQWRRGTTNIGTNSSAYTLQHADVGSTITVTVTRGTMGSVTSSATITVPQPTASISGTAQVGSTLTANVTNLGGTLSYQWRRGATNVGTNSSTYVVQSADAGSSISVVVSVTGVTGTVTSNATATVPQPSVSITGTAQVGNTLTASVTNIGSPTYQWRRGTTNISGATGSTYLVQFADVGSAINVVVSGVTSASTASVPQPAVTVTGNAIVGQTLTANVTNLGGTLTYQWMRDGTNISGATSSSYTVQAADAGLPITVTVTRSGITGSITSAPVAAIIQLAFSTTVQGSITASSPAIRYQVVLAQNGTLVINLTSPGGSTALPNNGADVQWFNSSGTRIGGTTGGFSFPYTSSDLVLNAGTYFIEVTGRGGIGQTGLYNIRVDYFTSEAANNTTLANAQVLVSGLTVRGELTSSKDRGIFRYNLAEPGRFTMNVTSGTLSSWVYIRWLDSNGTQIRNNDTSLSSAYNQSMDLEAGVYYIEVVRQSATGTYNLRGDFSAAGNNEIEPNNILETAQLLTLGQTVKGFLSYQDDRDIYRYNLTQPGRFTMNVTGGTLSSWVYIRWLDSNGIQIRNNDISLSSAYNQSMDLEAGVYYIEVVRQSATGTYNLSGGFVASGRTTIKPNDTRATAQLLTSGQSVIGFISHQEGRDMYRIVLTQARRLTVNVSSGTLSSWVFIRWLDTDGNQMLNHDRSLSSTYNHFMDLAAGTYYIEIVRQSTTGTYNMSASW